MIECINFKSHVSGTLQGFADFYVHKWDLEVNNCSLHMKDGKRWIYLPTKEYKNQEGETKYSPIIRFRKQDNYREFSTQAKKSIDAWCIENGTHQELPEESNDNIECPF